MTSISGINKDQLMRIDLESILGVIFRGFCLEVFFLTKSRLLERVLKSF